MKKKVSISFLVSLTVILGTAAVCCLIRPAADDFFYATFCDGGFSEYLSNTLYHYQHMTGRVFVHLILCPLLQLNMWPFRIFNLLLICFLAWLGAKVCAGGPSFSLPGFAAFLCLFWLMGIRTLSDAALWGAGALNYLFPTTLVILYAYLFQKYLVRGTGGSWLFLAAFLCSATVEMTGILNLFVILYLCLVNREQTKQRVPFVLVNFLSALLGYLSLYTSPGVGTRLEQTVYTSMSLLERINVNFALFDRKICGPGGIWVIVLLTLAAAALLLFRRGKRLPAALATLSTCSILLTGSRIICNGIALAVIALAAFAVLCLYSVWSFRTGDRIIPLFMLGTTVSLGICLVSPVVGPRMLFTTAIFLSIICVRSLFLCEIPQRAWNAMLCGLAVPTVLLLCFYTVKFSENAEVIDHNTALTAQCSSGEVLTLSHVPDEVYGGMTVPSGANFGFYYLENKGLSGVTIRCTDPTEASITCNGAVLSHTAVLRGGQYYVPVRIASEVLHADVSWELASAVVETETGTYYFHNGNHVVNLGQGLCSGIRLKHPVRSINNSTYISQQDFEFLFGVQLRIPGDT